MKPFDSIRFTLAALLCVIAAGTQAQPLQCDIAGLSVNPANGSTTAGRTGIMRCRDADGRMQREEELRDGKFVGMRTFYERDGGKRIGNVNERGNRDGLQREYWPDGSLKREETAIDGSTVGVTRSFHPGGKPQRVAHIGPRQENLAENAIEFNPEGQVMRLSCAPHNRLAETERPCGFAGKSETALYNMRGELTGREIWEQGRLRQRVSLAGGKMIASVESTDTLRIERSFHSAGGVRLERQIALDDAGRPRNPREGLERESAESGQVTRETRWSAGVPVAEREWYLNGEKKVEVLRSAPAGNPDSLPAKVRQYWDNGKLKVEEERVDGGGRGLGRLVGTQRFYSEKGILQQEVAYHPRGYRERMKAFDADGALVREEEYFEDGSRKAPNR